MKKIFLFSASFSLCMPAFAGTIPGDINFTNGNASSNGHSYQYRLMVGSANGPATAPTGCLLPGSTGALSQSAIGTKSSTLYIQARDCTNNSNQYFKLNQFNYDAQYYYNLNCTTTSSGTSGSGNCAMTTTEKKTKMKF